MPRPLLAATLIVSLAACQAEGTGEPAPTASDPAGSAETTATPDPQAPAAGPTTESAAADASGCGADQLDRWLNVLPTETAKAEIAATVGERPIRYYTQGDPITMDFNPSRLNAELGEDGRIKLFRCG